MPRYRLFFRTYFCAVLVLILMTSAAESTASGYSFDELKSIISESTDITELDIGDTSLTPAELLEIKEMMPEGSVLHFSAEYSGCAYNENTVEMDLNRGKKDIKKSELNSLISLLPDLKKINVSKQDECGNEMMPELEDAHPDIDFVWKIKLPYNHSLLTSFTAYSTLRKAERENRMSEKTLSMIRYATELRALDLGHNSIKDISFLEHLPELRLLILADNSIRDITPLGRLKHLQYCELFMNYFSDLTPLGNCTELLDLNIAFTNVRSLDGLENCTKLERLWAPRIQNLDADSIERFKASHPDCELTFNSSGSTGYGWRQHWRYKHYVNLFKTHEWIPFEESTVPHD